MKKTRASGGEGRRTTTWTAETHSTTTRKHHDYIASLGVRSFSLPSRIGFQKAFRQKGGCVFFFITFGVAV